MVIARSDVVHGCHRATDEGGDLVRPKGELVLDADSLIGVEAYQAPSSGDGINEACKENQWTKDNQLKHICIVHLQKKHWKNMMTQ